MIQNRSDQRYATVQLASGHTVAYAEHGRPGGEPLVLLHGFTDSSHSFSRLLPLLDPNRYHAYALDQRGHGDSGRPAAGYAMNDFAADVAGFLDAIGVSRATVIGHSLGSLVARRFAITYPERVDRLVLIGSSFTFVNELTERLREAVQELEDPVPDEFAREFQASTMTGPLPEDFFEGVVAESLKVPARVWRDALDGQLATDDGAALGTITAPTLIIWGDQDPLFPREQQDRLVAAVPEARLLVYPDTSHNPHWEHPENVAYDITAFLRECQAQHVG